MRPVPGGELSRLDRGVLGILVNHALVAGVLACVIAQVAKVFTHYASSKSWDWTLCLTSGGMPSSHTALVVALATAIGVEEGTRSGTFALAMCFALVVMYDASGVRLHAGKAAAVLNHFLGALPEDHHLAGMSLRDKLGHEPEEVMAGAAVGVIVGWMVTAALSLGGGGAAAAPLLPHGL